MEYPKSNDKISNLHSQIVGSCCSISLPSEPPDIRNWFPSYAYESPLLGASENFADSVSQERECEKDKEVLRISETNCNGECTNQVSGSSHSLSLPSEPPGVGEWFSSYVYESPVLDTGFQDSHFKERECEDYGFVEESIIETEEDLGKLRRYKRRDEHTDIEKINSTRFVDSIHRNKLENQTLSKMVDSSVSFLLPSEPPDVGNWFSSYVYESPLLDSDLQDSHFSQRERVKDKIIVEKNTREEDSSRKLRAGKTDLNEIIVGKKVNSNELVKCIGAFENNKLENQSLSKDDDKVEESKNMSLHIDTSCGGGATLQTRCASPAKGMEESSVKEEDFRQKLDQFSQDDDGRSGKNNASSSSSKGLTQMKNKNTKRKSSRDFNLIEPESHIDSIQGYIASTPKPFPAGTNKENGFVSIRKKRCTKENVDNPLKMSHEVSLKPCLKGQSLSNGDLKEGVVERKVLGDKSNMQHSIISTVAGKWRCPQKSKPSLGPPMKQLRLEQWLHRI